MQPYQPTICLVLSSYLVPATMIISSGTYNLSIILYDLYISVIYLFYGMSYYMTIVIRLSQTLTHC